ncbi:MAG: GNAT family N-acetyltransferase [Saprospiraceae bacterium]|nr:GNAT family N-acetyltransferase [Candidatus Vicinibacter affinis]
MTIEKYDQKFDGFFESIWVDWLKYTMSIEPQPSDIDEVRNPFQSYIKNGGMAFYALNETKCVGVVAVKKLNHRDYEVCNLVVSEPARGMGLGKTCSRMYRFRDNGERPVFVSAKFL